MRIWSLHPKYLDTKGLVALWREGLLAQKVLKGKTKGYRNHPQLDRFKPHAAPRKAIAYYLLVVWEEANRRGYSFDRRKVRTPTRRISSIKITRGQLRFEWEHLRNKLHHRDPSKFKTMKKLQPVIAHPLFRVVPGGIEKWEVTSF